MAASTARSVNYFTSNPRTLLRRRLLAWRCLRSRVILLSTDTTGDKDTSTVQHEREKEVNTTRDPFPLFASKDVQLLLTRITGFDAMKVAGPHLKSMQRPVYKLLTDLELKQEQESASSRLRYRLQMPPFLKAREPVRTSLVDDPSLAGFDTSKYVFVDCSFGLKDRHRSVVVRDPDGSLSEASWDIKERINQIFSPREGRSVVKPKMFEEANLERMIHQKKFLYILNVACAQFEPDDPDFIRTSQRVYNAVNSSQDFELLRSTRFFGPMAFYLVWNNMCDALIIDMLNRDLLADAVDVVELFCLVHPDSPCANSMRTMDKTDHEAVMKAFIDIESNAKNDMKTSLQALLSRRPDSVKSSLLS